jgi:hypothetical protein
VERIDWNCATIGEDLNDFIAVLTEKKLKRIDFTECKPEVGRFALDIKRRFPFLEVYAWALDPQRVEI